MVMPAIHRAVVSRGGRSDWAAIAEEVEKTLRDEIQDDILDYYYRIVKPWDHQPEFKFHWAALRTDILGWVEPTGKDERIWRFVNEGTRKHAIRPVNAKALRFRSGYQPHTGLGGQYRGPGVATGNVIHAQMVMHPGTKPRNFDEHIARWYKSSNKFPRLIENAMRRGIRRS